jgi:transcriptional regulator with XRE-family HTH domain
MATLTDQEVLQLIRFSQGDRSLREFAKEVGVSAAYLSDILRGNRSPGEKILKFFKLKKARTVTVTYSYSRRRKSGLEA